MQAKTNNLVGVTQRDGDRNDVHLTRLQGDAALNQSSKVETPRSVEEKENSGFKSSPSNPDSGQALNLDNPQIPKRESPKSGSSKSESLNIISQQGVQKIDLEWDNLDISAKIKKKIIQNGKHKTVREEKKILNNVSGSVRNGRFTAIIGPSGSGKTTLLNFLSARISGENLRVRGVMKVNGKEVKNLESITSVLAYVMQDDILLATTTPREAFDFVAKLRLKITAHERKLKVQSMIKDLGLTQCANTQVGNNLIRGLSGGERKRTSIGVELMTNPSMIFLDEPTTGLDSKTSENLVKLLVRLAKEGGRTVVSTIHQPSSQIFQMFDELTILVRGNTIYQGKANIAVDYFSRIGFPCPELTNPIDHFMKITNETGVLVDAMQSSSGLKGSKAALSMSPEEVEQRFSERMDVFIKAYNESGLPQKSKEGIINDHAEMKSLTNVSWLKQFWYILTRKLHDEIRNPMEAKMKAIQMITFAIVIMIVFNDLGEGQVGIQNRGGVLNFIVSMIAFGGVQGSVATFSSERPIFIRERLNGSYATSAYFWAKACAELPTLIMQPVILIGITYYVIGLQSPAWKYFAQLGLGIISQIAAAGYGILISTFIPSMELAMNLVPMLLIPMMLFAGYFVSSSMIPYFFYEIKYISIFKYPYQAAMRIEYADVTPSCAPACDPFSSLDPDGIGLSIGIIVALAIGLRIVAYFGLIFVSTPKLPKIENPHHHKKGGSAVSSS